MDIVTLGAAIGAAKKNLNNVVAPVSASDAGKIATVDSNGKYQAAALTVGQGEVAVDTTLLVTGAAADAKVTGDKVAELKSAVDSVALLALTERETQNPTYCTVSSGDVRIYTSYSGCACKIYDVSGIVGNLIEITSTRLSGSTSMFYVFANSSGNAIDYYSDNNATTITNKRIEIPQNASLLYVNYDSSANNISVKEYVRMKKIEEQIEDINDDLYDVEKVVLTANNSYNNTYAKVSSNGNINTSSVSGTKCHVYSIADYAGKKIEITTTCIDADHLVSFIISNTSNKAEITKEGDLSAYVVDIPNNANNLYVNCVSTSEPTVKLIIIRDLSDVYDDLKNRISATGVNHRIVGKTCVCFGDSITWYDGHAYNWGKEEGVIAKGYESYMREAGMIVDNQGYSGATLKNIVQSKVLTYDFTDCDYVTLTSGANDARYMYAVGEVEEIGSTYEDTFIGWLQTALDYILSQNPEIKILLITPIRGWIYTPDGYSAQTPPLEDGIIGEEYPNAIKAVAEKYALPVCDWYADCGLNILTRSWYINDPEPDKSATPNPNVLYSLHPSTKGYKRMAQLLLPVLRAI